MRDGFKRHVTGIRIEIGLVLYSHLAGLRISVNCYPAYAKNRLAAEAGKGGWRGRSEHPRVSSWNLSI